MSWLLGLTLLAILQVTNGALLKGNKEVGAFKTKSKEVSLSARQFLLSRGKEVGQLLNLRIQPEGQSWEDKPAYVPRPLSTAEWSVEGSDGSLTWDHGGKQPQPPIELTNIEVAFSDSKENTLTLDINLDVRLSTDYGDRVLEFKEEWMEDADTLFSIFLFNEGHVFEGQGSAKFTTSDGYFDIWLAVCNWGSGESCITIYGDLIKDKRFLKHHLEEAKSGTGDYHLGPQIGAFRLDDEGQAKFSGIVDYEEHTSSDTDFKASRQDGYLKVELTSTSKVGYSRDTEGIFGIAVKNIKCHNPDWDPENFEELKNANVIRSGNVRETFAAFQSIGDTLLVNFMTGRPALLPRGRDPAILKFRCDDQASTDRMASDMARSQNQNQRKKSKRSKKSKKAYAKKSKKAHAKSKARGRRNH